MITVEDYKLVSSKTVCNPNFKMPQYLEVVYIPTMHGLSNDVGEYYCDIEYRIVIAKDIEEDILSALTLNYKIKGKYDEPITEEKVLQEMDHIVRDAIDYHCYMINIDPSLIGYRSEYN